VEVDPPEAVPPGEPEEPDEPDEPEEPEELELEVAESEEPDDEVSAGLDEVRSPELESPLLDVELLREDDEDRLSVL
jgi:hypothetical protein